MLVGIAALAGCYETRPMPSLSPTLFAPRVEARPTSGAQTWELDEQAAIAYALQHSPELAGRRDEEHVAAAAIGEARQLTNPELRIGRSSGAGLIGSSSKSSLAIRLHPDAPWTLNARVAQARAELQAEHALTAVTARALTAEIRRLYAELTFGEATRAMLDRQLAVLRERKRLVGERMERATATRLESLLTEQDLADLESTQAEIDVELAKARGKLAHMLGLPPGQPWRPVGDTEQLRVVRTGLDVEQLGRRALASRPELAEIVARADAAGARAFEERGKAVPWFSWLQVERSASPETEWSIGASITLPVFSLNRGAIEVAAAEQHRALRARDQLAVTTLADVAAAAELVEVSGKHARELAARFAPLEDEIAKLLEQERSAATADPLKLLLLEERHVRAQRALLEASYAHRLALIGLAELVGDLP